MHVCLHASGALRGQERDVRAIGAGVTDGCETPCRELNLGPPQEQALLTAKPALRPPFFHYLI